MVLFETGRIATPLISNSPVGPKVVPYIVGGLLLAVAAALAVEVARGKHGEPEAGEDVDLGHGTDWLTFGGLVLLLVACGQLIPVWGFPASGVVLFFGAARLLGSHSLVRDVVVSVVVPLTAYLVFTQALGVYLPAGPQ